MHVHCFMHGAARWSAQGAIASQALIQALAQIVLNDEQTFIRAWIHMAVAKLQHPSSLRPCLQG